MKNSNTPLQCNYGKVISKNSYDPKKLDFHPKALQQLYLNSALENSHYKEAQIK